MTLNSEMDATFSDHRSKIGDRHRKPVREKFVRFFSNFSGPFGFGKLLGNSFAFGDAGLTTVLLPNHAGIFNGRL